MCPAIDSALLAEKDSSTARSMEAGQQAPVNKRAKTDFYLQSCRFCGYRETDRKSKRRAEMDKTICLDLKGSTGY